jgi:hypothetical protein
MYKEGHLFACFGPEDISWTIIKFSTRKFTLIVEESYLLLCEYNAKYYAISLKRELFIITDEIPSNSIHYNCLVNYVL